MSILHITNGANYNVTKSYIKFINENFSDSHHKFIVIDNPKSIPNDLKRYDNIIIIDINKKGFRKLIYDNIRNSNQVILHSLCIDIYFQILLIVKPTFMRKIVWVSWGMDSYQWKRKSKKMIYKLRNFIAYKFRQKIKCFVGIFPPDIDFFKKEFNSNAKTFYASYTGNLYNSLYKKGINLKKLDYKVKCNEIINIQIGHSSTKALSHIDVLKSLEKFKDENIRLYLPLSYGDKNYGDYVEKRASIIFGDKAICIRKKMSKDDYMEHLSKIDIAIFNTTRQIGLGNISPMLYMEKKIFMPKGSVMYNFYKSQQVDIWDYNEIADFDFNEFVRPLDYKGGRNYIIENELNLEHKINMWNQVFENPLR